MVRTATQVVIHSISVSPQDCTIELLTSEVISRSQLSCPTSPLLHSSPSIHPSIIYLSVYLPLLQTPSAHTSLSTPLLVSIFVCVFFSSYTLLISEICKSGLGKRKAQAVMVQIVKALTFDPSSCISLPKQSARPLSYSCVCMCVCVSACV